MTQVLETLQRHANEALMTALLGVALAAAAAARAWFQKKTREWNAVKTTVRQVEDETSEPGGYLPGATKRRRALDRLRQTNPGLPEERASELIERVLPEVRRESERPPPLRRGD